MLTRISIITNIISSFTELISHVLEVFLHTAIIMIVFLHSGAVVHNEELMVKMWNLRSYNPFQTCCLLKWQRVNMHNLTFPLDSSIVRACGERATAVSSFQRTRLWIYHTSAQSCESSSSTCVWALTLMAFFTFSKLSKKAIHLTITAVSNIVQWATQWGHLNVLNDQVFKCFVLR